MKRITYISLLSGLLLITAGCDTFLDEDPDNRVDLDNLEKAGQLLVSAYSVSSPNFTDWLSDDVIFTVGTNIRLEHQEMFEWQDVSVGPTSLDTPIYYWFETYTAIAHANEVLAELDNLPANSDEAQARKRAVESEALLARAYGHFMLVNMFSQHYTGDNGSMAGVPYITTPETVFLAEYERESLGRVYDLIEQDLLRGIELVDDSFFENSGKYHFNRNAALAFASRFYLWQGNYDECIRYSDLLLGSNPGAFVRDLNSTEFRNASSSIIDYPQVYSSPDQASNFLLMRKLSLVQRTDFAYGPGRTGEYAAIFNTNPFPGATDLRENPALVKGTNALYPLRYQSLFERSSLNSNTGFPYYIHMAFTGEEVLLNRAEANIFQNNLSAVLDDMQVLSERRYQGNDIVLTIENIRAFYGGFGQSDRQTLWNYVRDERRKEFIMQGMRWFDIKRYELEVDHELENGSVATLTANDRRKALQIPTSAIDVGGLEGNPR